MAVKSRPAVENELEEIMRNHSQSFSLEKQTQRRTVSPLRLSLNTAHMKETDQIVTPEKVQNEEFVHEEDYDLTDRDSVRYKINYDPIFSAKYKMTNSKCFIYLQIQFVYIIFF